MEKAPIDKALELTGTTDETSMKMRYQNCLFLDKGKVQGSLSHASKLHQEAWNDVQTVYSTISKVKEEEDTTALFVVGLGFIVALYGIGVLYMLSRF
jgi:hypothetical protein